MKQLAYPLFVGVGITLIAKAMGFAPFSGDFWQFSVGMSLLLAVVTPEKK